MGDTPLPVQTLNQMFGKGSGPALARWGAQLCLCSHSQAGFPMPKNHGHRPDAWKAGQRLPRLLHSGS